MDIMTVRAPESLQDILTKDAKHKGIPRNALILQILWSYVENKKESGCAQC